MSQTNESAPDQSNQQHASPQKPTVIRERIFLVGCPRSGTTLLQSLLAAHPQIASFPESHFFERISKRFASVGLVSPKGKGKKQLYRFLADAGHPELAGRIPKRTILVRKQVSAFVEILDTIALEEQKSLWVEKTPGHLRQIDLIEKYIPGARFIHILRNGPDVVASLYEVKNQHPEIWPGPRTIDRCITRWNQDLELTRRHVHKEHHTLVRYEQLVEHPETVLAELCRFIRVPFSPEMIVQHGAVAENLVLRNEVWKHRALGGEIRDTGTRKFDALFDQEQKQYIFDRLLDPDL